MTEEFPRARLFLVKYLHEEMGFDVLALEGSAMAAWLAQEQIYTSKEPGDTTAARAQEIAWFNLWQTDAMKTVMDYVTASRDSAHPLYLASFDIEAGASHTFQGVGKKTFAAFLDGLTHYGNPPHNDDFSRWQNALGPVFGCIGLGPRSPVNENAARLAVDELEHWTSTLEAQVGIRSPIHARMMQIIPDNLRDSIEVCRESQAGQPLPQLRDRAMATEAMRIHASVSGNHRVMVWAHHSHVGRNVLGRRPLCFSQRTCLASAHPAV